MIEVFTDGASRSNPGPSALGAVARKDGELLFELSEYLGVNTNNYAEYMAAIRALEKLKEDGFDKEKITVYADSKLLVEQASGRWKVKHPNIKPLFERLQDLLKGFKSVTFAHVPREQNKRADELANMALDQSLSD